MRTWFRVPVGSRGELSCGGCGRTIADGEAVQVVALKGISGTRKRCRECATGEPPDPCTLAEFMAMPAAKTSQQQLDALKASKRMPGSRTGHEFVNKQGV